MTRAIEVEVDAAGQIHPVTPEPGLPKGRALLTWQTGEDDISVQLSEASLAEDWLRPEEDTAWEHLQPGK